MAWSTNDDDTAMTPKRKPVPDGAAARCGYAASRLCACGCAGRGGADRSQLNGATIVASQTPLPLDIISTPFHCCADTHSRSALAPRSAGQVCRMGTA